MARKFLEITHILATLSVGQTTKEDVLKVVPTVRREELRSGSNQEYYSAELSNWNGAPMRIMTRFEGKKMHSIAYSLGFRALRYQVSFHFAEGVLSEYGYSIWIDDGSFGIPGLVMATTRVRDNLQINSGRNISTAADENPDYQVSDSSKWPKKSLWIGVTSTAGGKFRHDAFDLRLNCILTLPGCHSTRQILPLAWEDKLNIDEAKQMRLRSQEPCPPRVLQNITRIMPFAFLLRVQNINRSKNDWDGGEQRFAASQTIEVLKEEVRTEDANRGFVMDVTQLARVEIPETKWERIREGDTVILFTNPHFSVEPTCNFLPATPENVAIVRSAASETLRAN